jgi:hypothetical protein
MNKLTQLRAIIAKLTDELGSHDLAVRRVGELLGRSRWTVYRWLNKSQTTPIPDNELKLLIKEVPL